MFPVGFEFFGKKDRALLGMSKINIFTSGRETDAINLAYFLLLKVVYLMSSNRSFPIHDFSIILLNVMYWACFWS